MCHVYEKVDDHYFNGFPIKIPFQNLFFGKFDQIKI